jgi:hypothetical protein
MGEGTIKYSDGSQYAGNIHNNMREGKGELKFGKDSDYLVYNG